MPKGRFLEGNKQAPGAVYMERAEVVDVFRNDPEAFGKSDGAQAEVGPAQPERGQAHDDADQGRQQAAHQHADPGRDAVLQGQYGGGVGADADENGMPQGQHPGEAAHEVPRSGQVGVEKEQDEDLQIGWGGHHQGQGEDDQPGQAKQRAIELFSAHDVYPPTSPVCCRKSPTA